MTTLEIILSACLLGLSVAWYGETRLRREAVTGWTRCLHERTALARQNYELRSRLVAMAMRNEDLENQVSAMTSRRYERN